MLEITVPSGQELFDEINNQFVYTDKDVVLRLEHSLVSISKWESKWCVPYMSEETKSPEQTMDYIKCMNMTQNVPDSTYSFLTAEDFQRISDYINAPMTATTFHNYGPNKRGQKTEKIITSELLYYWMVSFGIPSEYQKWHINRLLTLIKICNIKNQDPKSNKMSKSEVMRNNHALNQARRAKARSKG